MSGFLQQKARSFYEKIVLGFAVAFAVLASAAITSCGTDLPEYDARQDTVLTLDAPAVTARAYPGVNYVSWTPVASAKEYVLYRTSDGQSDTDVSLGTLSNNVFAYADVAAADNVLADGKCIPIPSLQ